MPLDLLAPVGAERKMRENYIHQLRQTINAYLPSFIFVGEALQNALDAVREKVSGHHRITVDLDFDQRRVTVTDTGCGFPDKPDLLFLGGGTKEGRGLAGMIGVGLKVVLFSSNSFTIRARNARKNIRVDVRDAYRFRDQDPPPIELPTDDTLPNDPNPLFTAGSGTQISYEFPPSEDGIPERYLRDVYENCITGRPTFEESLTDAVSRGGYPNRLAALIASDLRRYSYLGSTVAYEEFANLTVQVTIKGSNEALGQLGSYADGKHSVTFEVTPRYFEIRDSLAWARAPKPVIQSNPLGDGGSNLRKTLLGFNVTTYSSPEDFEQLLINARGKVSQEVDRFRRLLFPKLRTVTVTIGRIPQFSRYLPGGARRVISARGVVTQHDIDVSSGQNQQYVRCFDIVLDVDADLNYGKTHLVDTHLVANVRRFVNEAYRSTIQSAARNFVGTLKMDHSTTIEKFWSREDLGITELASVKAPYDENDVIALFFEMTGRGHFSYFKWYGLSQRDTYDARAIIRRTADPETLFTSATERDLRVIEFKLRGASIARDFDQDEKRPDRVDLVICYEIGVSPVDLYQVIDVEDSNTSQSDVGPYPGVTHVLLDTVTGREVQVLSLKEHLREAFPSAEPASIPGDAIETD